MHRKTQTIRFVVLADKHTLSNRPYYAITAAGNREWAKGSDQRAFASKHTGNRIDEQQIFKRPDTIPT